MSNEKTGSTQFGTDSYFGGGGKIAAQISPARETLSVGGFIEILRQAEAKTAAKQWAKAAALWEKAAQQNPVNGRFWYQTGTAYYRAKDYRKSIPAYEKQIELGYGIPANAAYNIACDYARF